MSHKWFITKHTAPARRTRTSKQAVGTRAQPMFTGDDVRRLYDDVPVRKQRQRELEAELESRRVTKLATGETVHFVTDEASTRTIGAGDGKVAKRASYLDPTQLKAIERRVNSREHHSPSATGSPLSLRRSTSG
jgi:hypothetical protein